MAKAGRSGAGGGATAGEPRRLHLGFRIGRVTRLLRQRNEARAKQIGLTPAQVHALNVVRYNENRSQRHIAETLEVGEVTAGRLICRLEANGWVERRPDPDDGRAMRVHLGAGAAGVLRQLDEIAAAEEREALANLSPADVESLLRVLDAIAANLGRPIDLSAFGDGE